MQFGIVIIGNREWDGQMFEVTEYTHPCIFVTCRRTGETYLFFVGTNGIVTRDEPSDQGRARQAAIAYLADRARAA